MPSRWRNHPWRYRPGAAYAPVLRAGWSAEDLAHRAEGGPRSDERSARLQPQTSEPGMAIAENHLDARSPSLGGGNSGCGCCYGHRYNLSWVNVVPSKPLSPHRPTPSSSWWKRQEGQVKTWLRIKRFSLVRLCRWTMFVYLCRGDPGPLCMIWSCGGRCKLIEGRWTPTSMLGATVAENVLYGGQWAAVCKFEKMVDWEVIKTLVFFNLKARWKWFFIMSGEWESLWKAFLLICGGCHDVVLMMLLWTASILFAIEAILSSVAALQNVFSIVKYDQLN